MGGIAVLILLNYPVNLRSGDYHIWFFFWINAIGAIVVGWNLARKFEQQLLKAERTKMIHNWLISVGRNSIIYLCLNQLAIALITKVLNYVGCTGTGIIIRILVFAITLIVLYVAERVICNTKMKVIIGR